MSLGYEQMVRSYTRNQLTLSDTSIIFNSDLLTKYGMKTKIHQKSLDSSHSAAYKLQHASLQNCVDFPRKT